MLTRATWRRSLQRIVRRLVFMLLGKQNFENLYHKNHTAKQFEAYAKKHGLTMIPLGSITDPTIVIISALDGMVYPLANAKQEHAEENQKRISLWYKIKSYCKTGNHAHNASNGECLPPMFYLKPGERITHVMVKSPNDPSSATRPEGDSK